MRAPLRHYDTIIGVHMKLIRNGELSGNWNVFYFIFLSFVFDYLLDPYVCRIIQFDHTVSQ